MEIITLRVSTKALHSFLEGRFARLPREIRQAAESDGILHQLGVGYSLAAEWEPLEQVGAQAKDLDQFWTKRHEESFAGI